VCVLCYCQGVLFFFAGILRKSCQISEVATFTHEKSLCFQIYVRRRMLHSFISLHLGSIYGEYMDICLIFPIKNKIFLYLCR
jgi:hypothetical protein